MGAIKPAWSSSDYCTLLHVGDYRTLLHAGDYCTHSFALFDTILRPFLIGITVSDWFTLRGHICRDDGANKLEKVRQGTI